MSRTVEELRELFGIKSAEAPKVRGTGSYGDTAEGNKEELGNKALNEFVNNGAWMEVNSSNVGKVQYNGESQKMLVQYKDGSAYEYSNVSRREAISFARAGSKGGWCWDHLRVRGTKNGHRKPFRKLWTGQSLNY